MDGYEIVTINLFTLDAQVNSILIRAWKTVHCRGRHDSYSLYHIPRLTVLWKQGFHMSEVVSGTVPPLLLVTFLKEKRICEDILWNSGL